ncbi:MAG: zinc-dependent metalloprotease family protein [Idiomarina sp.]
MTRLFFIGLIIFVTAFDASSGNFDSFGFKKSDFVRMTEKKTFFIDGLEGRQRKFEVLSSNVNNIGVLVREAQEVGSPQNTAYIYSKGDSLEAYFYINGKELFLDFDGKGRPSLTERETNSPAFVDDAIETLSSDVSYRNSTNEYSIASAGISLDKVIRVLIVLSPQAEAESWDVEPTISHWFSMANKAMSNNDRTDVILQPAAIVTLTSYPTTLPNDMKAHLNWVKNNSGVGQIRSQHKADLVSLVIANAQSASNSKVCGYGYINSNYGSGFTASKVSSGCGSLTFAHEIGHNLGAEHDPFILKGDTPAYSYGTGYVDSQNSFVTVMGYNSPGSACEGCIRIPYFSSSITTSEGLPIGVAGISENDRVIANRAATVAGFAPKYTSDIPNLNDTPLYCRARGQLAWNAISGADSYKLYSSSYGTMIYPDVIYEGSSLSYSYNFPS